MEKSLIVTPADVEREIGLSRETLRKWKSRYGFPATVSEGQSEAGFTPHTVKQLRAIKRLIDSGFRPSQLVGKSLPELELWTQTIADECKVPARSPVIVAALQCVQANQIDELIDVLDRARAEQSSIDFVRLTLAPLADALGQGWVAGNIEIFQEHLCTGVLLNMLHREIIQSRRKPGYPRILFASPRGELHVMGLLMAQAVLGSLGAHCIVVGPHMPVAELEEAARATQADIVGLSFSFAYPKTHIAPAVAKLREKLPDHIEIWCGGAGAKHIGDAVAGVKTFHDLFQAEEALNQYVEQRQAV